MHGPTEDDVAAESGTSIEFVRRVVAAGIFAPTLEGSFGPDAHAIARTVRALQRAGFEPELVHRALVAGFLSLEYVEQFSVRQANRSGRTYAEFIASRGERGRSLGAVYAALGLPEPEPATYLSREEETLVGEFLDTWSALSHSSDAPVRGARIVGEGARRIVESFLDTWDDVARADWKPGEGAGISAPGDELAARMAAMLPAFLGGPALVGSRATSPSRQMTSRSSRRATPTYVGSATPSHLALPAVAGRPNDGISRPRRTGSSATTRAD